MPASDEQLKSQQKGLIGRKYKNSLKLNAEGIVWQYFRNKNCNINLGRYITDEQGTPDFFVENGKDRFWVEVKKQSFSLSDPQVSWLLANFNENVFLAVVDGMEIKFYKFGLSEGNL